MALTTLTHRSQIPRSGMALGGIGTGGFEIRQDGGFANWSLFNNAPLFAGPPYPFLAKETLFFKLWVRVGKENPRLVLLQIEDSHNAGAIRHHEHQYIFPWLSGVDAIRLTASFPFADLEFEREGLPLRMTLRAWSPFIPGNVKDSALPLAYFDFDIISTGSHPVELQILGVLRNAVAYDQPERLYANRRIREEDFSAVVCEAAQTDPAASTTGSLCLAAFSPQSRAYMGWEHPHPYYERCLREFPLPEHDDTAGRNTRDRRTGQPRADERCFVTLGIHSILAKRGESLRGTFALTWHFPNNLAKEPGKIAVGYLEDATFPGREGGGTQDGPKAGTAFNEGHFYAEFFGSAEEAARYAGRERERLLAETTAFHTAFFDSSLPGWLLDQVNSQLNTLRTSAWLTRTRMFGVLEGLAPDQSYAGLATTDVAMYGQIAVALLFPELDRMTVDLWCKFQKPDGIVIHSVSCHSEVPNPAELDGKRLDMPAQFAFMALRAAFWSGDRPWLEKVWPHVKSALAYVLRERDPNGDSLPDMEGIMCSYDNFPMYGIAPYVATQWLAAVTLALEAARRLNDAEFVAEYSPRLAEGRKALESSAWNGAYFDLSSESGPKNAVEQKGCLADQIIGDGSIRQLGIGQVVEPGKARAALEAVMRLNYKPDQGLRNCQWPGDGFLHPVEADCWVDQANTCWTGVELNFAAHLLYMGLPCRALEIIRNVDDRHRRWGMYWDHQEFGGHYFRPLSALAIPNAWLGLSYDGLTLRIAPAHPLPLGRWCVLLPGAWGTFFKTPNGARLEILSGRIAPDRIEIPLPGEVSVSGFASSYRAEPAVDGTNFLRT